MSQRAGRTASILLLAALLLASTRATAAAVPGGLGAAAAPTSQRIDQAELRRLLDQVVAAGAPGAAAMVRDEQSAIQAAAGVADLGSGRPMWPWLHYRVGSLTKPMTATVMLQLVAERRLSLSDTVERWLPGILPYGDKVTIRQLLSHTGGVPDYLSEPIVRLYTDPQARFHPWTPRELVALVAHRPLDFAPGTAWRYSNTDYVLAGLIVQAATGHNLGQELTRRIFWPLGLHDTFFPVNRPTIPQPNARGYSLLLGQADGPLLDLTVYNPSLGWGAGNVISDLGDLERFFRALLGGRLLPPPLLAEMMTTVPTGVPGFGYGLGLTVVELPSGRLIGHDGASPGFFNVVFSTPDGRRQLGLMMNEEFATPAVSEAFNQALVAVATGILTSSCSPPTGPTPAATATCTP